MNDSTFSLLREELISKIFLASVPDQPSLKANNAPLLLTHVCHHWRLIAQDIPQLWSHIAIPRWQECPAGIVQLVNLWISYSGDSPLSIDIALFNQDVHTFANPMDAEGPDEVMNSTLELLAPNRSRMRNLWGVFPAAFVPDVGIQEITHVERLFFYGTPKYNDLLRIPSTFDTEDARTKLDIGPFKENLRILSVCDCPVEISSIMLQTQLTHLELFNIPRGSGICQENAFKLLQSLPNLQKCVLELVRQERFNWNGQRSRLVLNEMELLFLIWKFPADIGILLDSLVAPNLVRLGSRGTPTVSRSWSGLYDFFRASHAPLTRLSLGNLEDIDIQLLDCLRCCPLLTHLSFDHSYLPGELFLAMTCQNGVWEADLLPHLEILILVTCNGIIAGDIAEFLRSRAKNVPPGYSCLREVQIVSCFNVKEEHVPKLEQSGVEKLVVKVSGDYLS